MSPTHKLWTIHALNHTAVVALIVFADPSYLLISFLGWCLIGSLGISCGFHRLLAHKSFKCPQWFENLCVTLGSLASFGSPIAWAASHRMHHAFPDKEGDPHSPHLIGFLRSYFHIWTVKSIPRQFIRDLLKKPYLKFIHQNYFKIILMWAGALYCIDWKLGVILFSGPSVIGYHSTGLVDAVCHLKGYRSFETKDFSRNNWWVNLLTFGEGFHNNHHYRPNSYRLGIKWYEFDVTAFIVESLGFVGKAEKNRWALQFKTNKENQSLDPLV